MKRRKLLAGAASALAGAVCALPEGAVAQPRYTVSAAQLDQVLAQRFPLRYPVAGLLELRMDAPRLRFLPHENRVGSELAVQASGEALRRSHSGTIDLDFALRYEPADRTIRAHQIRVHAVRLPSLAPDAAALISAYARASAERSLLEVVLHTLRPQDLALADTMGFQPGSINVMAGGLVVEFVAREPR
jgi:hypothetical protein